MTMSVIAQSKEVQLIKGGVAVDDRGQLQFCNDFDMQNVRRFYVVSNHKDEFIRAWHGHKNEAKYVSVVSGAAIVCAVKIDNWEEPDKNATVHRHILSEKAPNILYIPEGHANGVKTLAPNTRVIFYSTCTLDESLGDDYRYESHYWNPWHVEER